MMRFVDALAARYGEVGSAEELALWSQLVTYEGQRAMFEAYTRNKYTATGVIQWMLNNSWPSLIWHLFDWYLRPGGGYFGTQKACEPLHVMYSYDDRTVVVTNQWSRGFLGLSVRVRVREVTASGVVLPAVVPEQIVRDIYVEPDGKAVVMTLSPPAHAVRIIDLLLTDEDGHEISRNMYWIPKQPDVVDYEKANWLNAPTAKHADLSALRRLPITSLTVSADRSALDGVRVSLTNPSDRLAFFVELRLVDASGADVLPVLWSDNYVSLLPGTELSVRATAHRALPQDLHLELRGLNVPPQRVPLPQDVAAEPPEERQADGIPALPLDAKDGPAPVINVAQRESLVVSIVNEAIPLISQLWFLRQLELG